MDWLNIGKAALALGALGLVLGALLAVAARAFTVEEDERTLRLTALLPGANCGACGSAGCAAYAQAVVRGDASVGACTVGGGEVARQMAEILGIQFEPPEKKVAAIQCSGGEAIHRRYEYVGVKTCFAASRLAGGPTDCAAACLGLGDCARACAFDAVALGRYHAEIVRDNCTGCGKCAVACPRRLITLIPARMTHLVACSSRERGNQVRAVCAAGCISCGLCVGVCPEKAITMTDNLARIDQSICTGCGKCAEICPRHIIHVLGVGENEKAAVM